MSKKSSARIDGPLSFGFPDPLNTRPLLDIKICIINAVPHLTYPQTQEYAGCHQ